MNPTIRAPAVATKMVVGKYVIVSARISGSQGSGKDSRSIADIACTSAVRARRISIAVSGTTGQSGSLFIAII